MLLPKAEDLESELGKGSLFSLLFHYYKPFVVMTEP